jgi:hypothetical protein
MNSPDAAEQVERVLKPIQQFVRGWMLGSRADARAAQLGLPSGEALWIVGRAGVLGDSDASVAAAGLAFMAPAFVRNFWDNLPADLSPHDVADEYSLLCQEWGTEALAQFDPVRMDRLDELGRRVADAADGSIGTVFAGTRALPQPTEVGARVALTMHVLRELRGAAHIVALHACGLIPLQAVMVSPAPAPRSGAEWAKHLGWVEPFPEPTEAMRIARLEAERLTSEILVPIYATLSSNELADFAEIVETTRNAIDM